MLTQYRRPQPAKSFAAKAWQSPAVKRPQPHLLASPSNCLALDLDPTGPAITITFTYVLPEEPPCPPSNSK